MIREKSTRRDAAVSLGAAVVLVVALVAGIYGRLAGFGERQLAEDEYYFAEECRKHPEARSTAI